MHPKLGGTTSSSQLYLVYCGICLPHTIFRRRSPFARHALLLRVGIQGHAYATANRIGYILVWVVTVCEDGIQIIASRRPAFDGKQEVTNGSVTRPQSWSAPSCDEDGTQRWHTLVNSPHPRSLLAVRVEMRSLPKLCTHTSFWHNVLKARWGC